MKLNKILTALLLTPLLLSACSSSERGAHLAGESVIPRPQQIEQVADDAFTFTRATTWSVENEEQAKVAAGLTGLFARAAGFTPTVTIGTQVGDVCFVTDPGLEHEAYRLHISSRQIMVNASGAPGFFYALQTIRQLLPAEIESSDRAKGVEWSVPAVSIADAPRFGYRGLMLDAARFFIPKETVLKMIDCAAMLKINTLHFHLTDDNGWRLEIKKYPRLTEVGAWRVERDCPFFSRRNPREGEPTPVGGFYTHDDIRQIVAYAADRHIEVIPEIEMPAHANALMAAYPELACPVVDTPISVLPGMGGANAEIILCAGNDSVFTFLQDVIDEVIELFPSRYIHIGGDEAAKTNWKQCPRCQARMKAHRIPTEEELQGYFMTRVADYVRGKGRQPMGWDELTNAALPKDIVIYGWQAYGAAATKAAEQGHRFVMTPARILYLIRYQGPQWFEPVTYFGNITLKDVYNYEPVQPDWKPEYARLLMGVQASMWTEFCTSPEDVEYLVFPRLAALAEVAWSAPERKDWGNFLTRIDRLTPRWQQKGINYARSMFNLDHCVRPDGRGGLEVSVSSIRPDVEIRYTQDGGEPTAASALYTAALPATEAGSIRAATFMNGERKGEVLPLDFAFNKATGHRVEGNNPKVSVLTNGLRGSSKHSDFEWVGWYEQHPRFTIDLGSSQSVNTITLGCITNYGMGIHLPARVKVYISADDHHYRLIGTKEYTPGEIFREGVFITDIEFDDLRAEGRYIKMEIKNPGTCPADHMRPGQGTWMYFDEVIIK